MTRYNPAEIEPKWQKVWADENIYAAKDFSGFASLKEYEAAVAKSSAAQSTTAENLQKTATADANPRERFLLRQKGSDEPCNDTREERSRELRSAVAGAANQTAAKAPAKKFVMLTEFPYPSGAGLHMGHLREYTLGDIIARYHRQNGENVLFPMGYDAFGLPTENYAIKNRISPQKATADNIANFRRQFDMMGYSIDWSRSFATSDPEYYRWTQWLFLQFFKAGLAYQDEIAINWCPFCKTGLANEEVVNGRHERCDTLVEKKVLKQWMLRITDYAERLIDGLASVDYSPRIAKQQIDWIGKSTGAEIDFEIANDAQNSPEKTIAKNNYKLYLGSYKPWETGEDFAKCVEMIGEKKKVAMITNAWDIYDWNEKAEQNLRDASEFFAGFGLESEKLDLREYFGEPEKLAKKIREFGLVYAFGGNTFVLRRAFAQSGLDKILPEFLSRGGVYGGFSAGSCVCATDLRGLEIVDEPNAVPEKYDAKIIWDGLNLVDFLIAPHYKSDHKESEMVDEMVAKLAHEKVDFQTLRDGEAIIAKDGKIIRENLKLTVFTTRPDTIFGATFMVLAPEHPLVARLTTEENREKVETYVRAAAAKSEVERQETDREKTGAFTGSFAINPATGATIPIWVADYVLMGYGTGAIMAVPAHDERDYEFAQKFDIPIREVVAPDFGKAHDGEVDVRGTVILGYNPKTGKYLGIRTGTGDLSVWLPGGGLKDGETFEECARREFREETGYTPKRFVQMGAPIFSHYYNRQKQSYRRSFAPHFLAIVDEAAGETAREEHEKDFRDEWFDFDELYKEIAKYGSDTEHWLYILDMAKDFVANNLDADATPDLFSGDGIVINSEQFDGLTTEEAKQQIVAWLAKKSNSAREKVNYKLRDWIFSRQHYWGEPIPIIHCAKCGAVAVPDADLPVELPKVDHYAPTDDGQSPLSRIASWVNVKCPQCGGAAKRETDTMPNWAGSNWYYLRYFDAKNREQFADADKLKYWGMVDLYLGGMEHTTLHLLYSRFHHQFLYDQKLVPTPEPYAARRGQGIVLAADGRKMSKSLGNVVDPTAIIASGYGADAARLAVAFLAPYDQTTPWSPEGVAGCYRFLGRVWKLAEEVAVADAKTSDDQVLRAVNRAVAKVGGDIAKMNFNTAIAALMECLNDLNKVGAAKIAPDDFAKYVQILAPFAPHIAEEIWREILGHETSVHVSVFPVADAKYLTDDQITVAVQVNGKLRGEIVVAADISPDEVEKLALAHDNVAKFVGEKPPAKVIYVPGKIVNIVVE